MKKIIFVLAFLCICLHAFAQTTDELFSRANINYENGNYEEAIKLYEKILSLDKESSQLYYNLANAYFKSKKLGRAILNYERALRLSPRDRDIKENLNLAQGLIKDKIELPQPGFILSVILFFYNAFTTNELTLITCIFYFILVILLILYIFMLASRKRLAIFILIGAFLFLISAIFLARKVREVHSKEAIVVKEKIDIRSGPQEDFLLQFTLHEGTKLKIVSQRGNWFEIELSRDLKGWLPKDAVEQI